MKPTAISRTPEIIPLKNLSNAKASITESENFSVYKGRGLAISHLGAKTKSFFASVWHKIADMFTAFIFGPPQYSSVPRFKKASPLISPAELAHKENYLREVKRILQDVLGANPELLRRCAIPANALNDLQDDFIANYEELFETYFAQYQDEELDPADAPIPLPRLLPDLHDLVMAELLAEESQTQPDMRNYLAFVAEQREAISRRLRSYNRKLIPSSLWNPG